MDNAFTRTLRSAFVVGMGVAGIAVGNRVYGRHLLQEMEKEDALAAAAAKSAAPDAHGGGLGIAHAQIAGEEPSR